MLTTFFNNQVILSKIFVFDIIISLVIIILIELSKNWQHFAFNQVNLLQNLEAVMMLKALNKLMETLIILMVK